MGYKDIKTSFFTALKKSGIKDCTFQTLRHTFASHLVMSGVDLNTVKELMGHKSIEMTLRYAHLSPKHKEDAVNVLDNRFDIVSMTGTKEGTKELRSVSRNNKTSATL